MRHPVSIGSKITKKNLQNCWYYYFYRNSPFSKKFDCFVTKLITIRTIIARVTDTTKKHQVGKSKGLITVLYDTTSFGATDIIMNSN